MSLALTKWKVYLRFALVFGVAGAVGLVLLMNRSNSALVWFFGLTDSTKPMNVTWLMLWTAVAALFSWWTFSFTRGLWRDAKDMRRQSALEREIIAKAARETEFTERERRLDEKLKRATEEPKTKVSGEPMEEKQL